MLCNVPGCRRSITTGPVMCDEHLSNVTPATRADMGLETAAGKAAIYSGMAEVCGRENRPTGSWLACARRWARVAEAEREGRGE